MRRRRGRHPRGGDTRGWGGRDPRRGREPRGPAGPGGRWAGPWVRALTSLRPGNRAQAGFHDARAGRVLRWELLGAEAHAAVSGERPEPHVVRFALAPLTLAQWDAVIGAVARRPDFTERLLNGEMPYRIEDAFREARAPLFPAGGRDVRASCDCPEGATGCRHVAAVHYALADAVEQNPFLLFSLRGRDVEQVLHALRVARAPAAAVSDGAAEADALTADPVAFWRAGPRRESAGANGGGEPAMPGGTLRRLGTPPFGDETEAVENVLRRTWAAAAAAAAQQLRR